MNDTLPERLSCSTPKSELLDFIEPLELDTRPIFARGETPCEAIDAASARLVPGQPFVLIVPFEPVPLYAKFGKQGFTHQASELSEGVWRVEFRKAK